MSSSNLDYSHKLEITQKNWLFTYRIISNNFFPLDYDLYLCKTYTDCSKIIHDPENRDLKNFQYFFLTCNLSLTSQFMPIKLGMYFLPLKMTENLIQRSHWAGFLRFKGALPVFIWKTKNMNKKFTCALMFFQS